jgi:glycerophosphoryl diester phosphodiesterase
VIPRRADGTPLRILHRANTLEAIEAGLAAGLDGVEVDVVYENRRLVLAHSREELEPGAPTLLEALDLAGDAFVLVDLKQGGLHIPVAEALRPRIDRSLVCSLDASDLSLLRREEPRPATSISYPRDRMKASERGLPGPVLGAAAAMLRVTLPFRIGRMLTRAQADATTLHHLVLSHRTVERCHARGAAVIAWTVNEPDELERVIVLGVDGVVTDDPGVFARATIAASCGVSPPS